jgi:hypothetical protein
LEKIGNITINKNTYHYRVMGLKNCLILRYHFNKYELMTYKLVYFKLWSQVLDIMEKGDHLTESGLLRIVNIKASFKKGLNSKLLEFFPKSDPILKPDYKPNLELMNFQWISGFLNTDGSFGIIITKKNKMNYGVIPMIRIYQDTISLIVLESIKNVINSGYILKPSTGRNVATLVFSDKVGINKLIQLCNEFPLLGSKNKDCLDFCKAYNLFLKKEHFNSTGLQEIIKIARGMNSGRKFD